MTAADLLAARDADFLAFCAQWQRDGRAFLGSADWFEERGMDGQARAWVWAAERGKRPFHFYSAYVWHTNPDDEAKASPCGVPTELYDGACHNLPGTESGKAPTFAAAVAILLDRWAEVFGTEPVPAESTPADAAARGG